MRGDGMPVDVPGETSGAGARPDPTIGVGMLGYGFMGRVHALAYRTAPSTTRPPLLPRLVALAGRSQGGVADAAARLGFERHVTDWRELLDDGDVGLVDVSGPNDVHTEAAVAAARSGRHVFCEKPLGRDAAESHAAWRAAEDAGVVHLCGFNYRFVPAVRLARELIDAGELGEIRHFRARYLQSGLTDPDAPVRWRHRRAAAGSGALGDLGAHIVDLGRYLAGEVEAVAATTRTFVRERPGGHVDVDDAFEAVVEFESGAVGTLEASRMCVGRKNSLTWEISGAEGSLTFDLERLNELRIALRRSGGPAGDAFSTVLVSGPDQPFGQYWWPAGHVLGWEHTFVHEVAHLLEAIAGERRIGPHGATFEDGYRAAEVCDAVLRSAASGRRERIEYRS
jgi:predicted dehydrogenase